MGERTHLFLVLVLLLSIITPACSDDDEAVAGWDSQVFYMPGASAGRQFGEVLACTADGTRFLAGVYRNNSVYIIGYTEAWGWLTNSIHATTVGPNANFGSSIAMVPDGLKLFIGAMQDTNNAGSVWGSGRFVSWGSSDWNPAVKLTPVSGSGCYSDAKLGWSTAISDAGDRLILGSMISSGFPGQVYRYAWSGAAWAETKITSPSGVNNDYFGSAVALSGDGTVAAVGAKGLAYNTTNYSAGVVYLYVNGVQEGILRAPVPRLYGYFGAAVRLSSSGDVLAVGASNDSEKGEAAGAVYIFRRNGSSWNAAQTLYATAPRADALFGSALALSRDGNTLVVGAPEDGSAGTRAGAVYVYSWDGAAWSGQQLLENVAGLTNRFGYAVAVSDDGRTVYAGAPGNDTKAANAGAVYRLTRK